MTLTKDAKPARDLVLTRCKRCIKNKKRCDQKQPTCQACVDAGVECKGRIPILPKKPSDTKKQNVNPGMNSGQDKANTDPPKAAEPKSVYDCDYAQYPSKKSESEAGDGKNGKKNFSQIPSMLPADNRLVSVEQVVANGSNQREASQSDENKKKRKMPQSGSWNYVWEMNANGTVTTTGKHATRSRSRQSQAGTSVPVQATADDRRTRPTSVAAKAQPASSHNSHPAASHRLRRSSQTPANSTVQPPLDRTSGPSGPSGKQNSVSTPPPPATDTPAVEPDPRTTGLQLATSQTTPAVPSTQQTPTQQTSTLQTPTQLTPAQQTSQAPAPLVPAVGAQTSVLENLKSRVASALQGLTHKPTVY